VPDAPTSDGAGRHTAKPESATRKCGWQACHLCAIVVSPMARMPATRNPPLNPSVGAQAPAAAPNKTGKPVPGKQPGPPAPEPPPADEATERDGGFHESSYELRHGLEVNESEWPDDTTIPGALGDR
jgi:hypothetical protein